MIRVWNNFKYVLFCTVPVAVILILGCKGTTALVREKSNKTQVQGTNYPGRPRVAAPGFRVFHQDEDTYTLVTKADATDDEVEAILWELRDAAKEHGFEKLKLSQKFVDARKPVVWFHVYRGAKCANEKFVKGKYPCGAKYHGAGDYTLGDYKNPNWDDGVLHKVDGSEMHLWDTDAK